jgi:hypothetical protein
MSSLRRELKKPPMPKRKSCSIDVEAFGSKILLAVSNPDAEKTPECNQ